MKMNIGNDLNVDEFSYDGNVHDSLQSDTTHVIIGDDQPTEVSDILHFLLYT